MSSEEDNSSFHLLQQQERLLPLGRAAGGANSGDSYDSSLRLHAVTPVPDLKPCSGVDVPAECCRKDAVGDGGNKAGGSLCFKNKTEGSPSNHLRENVHSKIIDSWTVREGVGVGGGAGGGGVGEGVGEGRGGEGELSNPDQCYSWLHTLRGRREKKASESSSDSGGSSSSESNMPMPPALDGGWGWFVVLGALLVNLICDGLSYCFGLLYSELLAQFHSTRSMTSAVGSVFFGVSMILGPLASSLTTRFGCRTMTIFGGILASFGLFISSFASSIEMLCVTFGVVVGTGFSFCYITSVVIVAFYFEKRRALATGLAVCGTGIGTFTFAPLIDFLISEYGWRGLFLILSGISLHLVVCGMLFRPLKFTEIERWQLMLKEFNRLPYGREEIEVVRSRYPSEASDSDSDAESSDEDTKALSALNLPTFVAMSNVEVSHAVLMEAIKNSNNPHRTMQRYMTNAMMRLEPPRPVRMNKSKPLAIHAASPSQVSSQTAGTEKVCEILPSPLLDDSKMLKSCRTPQLNSSGFIKNLNQLAVSRPTNVFHQTDPSTKNKEPIHLYILDKYGNASSIHGDDLKKKDVGHGKQDLLALDNGRSTLLAEKLHGKESRLLERRLSGMHMGRHNALGIHLPLYRGDIFYRRLQKQNSSLRHCTLGTSCPEFTETASMESDRGCVCEMFHSLSEEVCDVLKSMVDVQLLMNPFFLILIMSNVLFYMWSDVPYMYAADHAMENGVDPQRASFLLSIVGIFNTIGQVVFGYIGDLNCNLLNVYAIVSVFAGTTIALIPLMPSYWSICILYGLFGFFVSVSFPLTTVLLVKYLGVEKLTSSYGLLMLMQGIANLLGPPFAGWVSDETGNYNASFYLSGLFYILSGLILFMVYVPQLKVAPTERRMSSTVVSEVEQV